jgi:hypothetical protein
VDDEGDVECDVTEAVRGLELVHRLLKKSISKSYTKIMSELDTKTSQAGARLLLALPVGALPHNLRLVIQILWQEATRAATAVRACIGPGAAGTGPEGAGTGLAARTGPAAAGTTSSAAGRHTGCQREAEGLVPAGSCSCSPLAPYRRWPYWISLCAISLTTRNVWGSSCEGWGKLQSRSQKAVSSPSSLEHSVCLGIPQKPRVDIPHKNSDNVSHTYVARFWREVEARSSRVWVFNFIANSARLYVHHGFDR